MIFDDIPNFNQNCDLMIHNNIDYFLKNFPPPRNISGHK